MLRRMVRAGGRRAGDDVEALAELVQVQAELEHSLVDAVETLRSDHGYSWAEIADRLGCTRQAAQQRHQRALAARN